MSMSNMGGTNFWARKMQSYGYNKETEVFLKASLKLYDAYTVGLERLCSSLVSTLTWSGSSSKWIWSLSWENQVLGGNTPWMEYQFISEHHAHRQFHTYTCENFAQPIHLLEWFWEEILKETQANMWRTPYQQSFKNTSLN